MRGRKSQDLYCTPPFHHTHDQAAALPYPARQMRWDGKERKGKSNEPFGPSLTVNSFRLPSLVLAAYPVDLFFCPPPPLFSLFRFVSLISLLHYISLGITITVFIYIYIS